MNLTFIVLSSLIYPPEINQEQYIRIIHIFNSIKYGKVSDFFLDFKVFVWYFMFCTKKSNLQQKNNSKKKGGEKVEQILVLLQNRKEKK